VPWNTNTAKQVFTLNYYEVSWKAPKIALAYGLQTSAGVTARHLQELSGTVHVAGIEFSHKSNEKHGSEDKNSFTASVKRGLYCSDFHDRGSYTST
jgi:hypothetical protein